jgi:transposase-like protein
MEAKAGRPREVMGKKRIGKSVKRLRRAGLSFGQIGKALGVSRQRAQAIHKRLCAEQSA